MNGKRARWRTVLGGFDTEQPREGKYSEVQILMEFYSV